jgi:REP element-mobilizing transposase RayT
VGYGLRDQGSGLFHVGARGNNKRPIFRSDDDRLQFLRMLQRTARRQEWAVHAYALMRNHFHLILRIEDGRLADGMRRINGGYALWFNAQSGRIDHLFGRRYWSARLEDERRYFAALRYVITNPARAGIPGPIIRHEWTSYPATLGRAATPVTIARTELLGYFDPQPIRAVASLRSLCEGRDGPSYAWAMAEAAEPRAD